MMFPRMKLYQWALILAKSPVRAALVVFRKARQVICWIHSQHQGIEHLSCGSHEAGNLFLIDIRIKLKPLFSSSRFVVLSRLNRNADEVAQCVQSIWIIVKQ